MKRRATDWETDEETEMEGEQTRGKGRRGKGIRKSERGPRELYLWRRVVMLEDSPGRICMVFNEEGGARWRRIIKKKKKEREKHSALNPSLRGKKKKKKTLSSRYAEVSLFKSLTPYVLLWKRGYTDKSYCHLKIVCYQQPSFAFEIILGFSTSDLEAYG